MREQGVSDVGERKGERTEKRAEKKQSESEVVRPSTVVVFLDTLLIDSETSLCKATIAIWNRRSGGEQRSRRRRSGFVSMKKTMRARGLEPRGERARKMTLEGLVSLLDCRHEQMR
jgi:hypothetical protein